MKKLTPNWFVEGLIDVEYKRYVLLAYLKQVQEHFSRNILYPPFSDLIFHYNNLRSFQEDKKKLSEQFPMEIKGLNLEEEKIKYEKMIEDGEQLKEIEDIVTYSIPIIKRHVENGKEIYEFIDEKIIIDSVGLMPLYKDEGYFLLQGGQGEKIKAYEYRFTLINSADEQFRGIHTQLKGTYNWSITNTFESIKRDLIKLHKKLPNPATFAITSGLHLPEKETLLPVAKRKFMRYIITEEKAT